jgi:hypothetical protein
MTHERQKVSTLSVSADEFIEQEMDATGWKPPPHFVSHLDRFIRHNREHPECHLGAIKITAWLERNGVVTGKDAVYRWLKKRSKVVK